MPTSRALTVVAEIDPRATEEERDALAIALAMIRDAPDDNPVLRPGYIPDTHFTRWLVLADDRDELPDLLIWESNHDGRTLDYLEAAVAAVRPGLDQLFACCTGYPGPSAAPEEVVFWLRTKLVRSNAFFRAYPTVSRNQVVNDAKVRVALRELVDADRAALCALPPERIQRALRARLAAQRPDLDVSDDGDGAVALFAKRAGAGLLALALLPVLPLIAVTVILLMRQIRRAEEGDMAIAYERPVHDVSNQFRFEDRVMQNQLTHLVDVKPGRFRLVILWLSLASIDALARLYYVHGELGGITTIHFARWVILYDRRPGVAARRHRLVFFSNYDGSWDAYLGEFIDRAAMGLTAAWSCTRGFPPSKYLLLEGATDEERFKSWTRDHQRPRLPGEVQAWWSGVPTQTVGNVRDNTWIRRRLTRRLADEELKTWLRRL
jgi:hypothetical protein